MDCAWVTSYGSDSGGAASNEVQYSYDGWGNVSLEQQEHGGAVSSNSLAVAYGYDVQTVGGGKNVRLTWQLYPNGRTVWYNYPSSGIGAAINGTITNETKYQAYSLDGMGNWLTLQWGRVIDDAEPADSPQSLAFGE